MSDGLIKLGDDTRFLNPIKISENKWVSAIIKEILDDDFISIDLGIATVKDNKVIIEHIERDQLVDIYRLEKSEKIRKELWDLLEKTSYGEVEE